MSALENIKIYETAKAVKASGANMVTEEVEEQMCWIKKPLLMDYINPKKFTHQYRYCFNSEDALRTLRLARWRVKMVKLEILGDKNFISRYDRDN